MVILEETELTSFFSLSNQYEESSPNNQANYFLSRSLSVFTPATIGTLSWNGLSDRATNFTYLILIFIAITLYVKFGNFFKLAYVFPLIIAIALSTFIAILIGPQKLLSLNDLRNQIFSSSQYIGEQSTSYNPLTDFIPAVKWIFALISLPYIVQILKIRFPKILKNCVYAWITGVLINSLTQILQFIGIAKVSTETFSSEIFSGSRFPGLSSHPNALAISVCLTLPLCFFPILKITKIPKIILTLFFGASILITGSRAGIIVFIAALILIISRSQATGKFRINLAFMLVFFSLMIILSGFSDTLLANTRLDSEDLSARASNSARVSLLEFGWTSFTDYPVTGAGTALIKVSHNIYLQILSSIGLIGFIAYCSFILRMLSNSARTSYLEKIPLLVFLMFGLLNNSLSDFYLYFPLGFAYAIKTKTFKFEKDRN